MSKIELLAPAGQMDSFIQAINSGADAIYLALEKFGARAYAKNFTKENYEIALAIAHELNKKIYVTVNTIVKENELKEAKELIDYLYLIGTDGLILADYALINYTLTNCPLMEVHISTQVGIKDLNDIKFFETKKVNRCVISRETSIDDLKTIKENSNMPLEVFAHGALCVSYSGGCLMSSCLSLRSGNRGRCSQNCRREYEIYKDNKLFAKKGYHLSMKDLCTFDRIDELKKIGIDSLKLEGRMKSADYVKTVTKAYRNKIDDNTYTTTDLNTVFHRNYTEGFLFNTSSKDIVDPNKTSNEGELVGYTISKSNSLTSIMTTKEIYIGDRIRIQNNLEEYYFTIDEIIDSNKKNVTLGIGNLYLNIFKDFKTKANIYRMIDSTKELDNKLEVFLPITITVKGEIDQPLTLTTSIKGTTFSASSDMKLINALNAPISLEALTKHIAKCANTALQITINNELKDNLFITVGEINSVRRKLFDKISECFLYKPNNLSHLSDFTPINYEVENPILTCYCSTLSQYQAAVEAKIDCIYFRETNYSDYALTDYHNIDDKYLLVGGYGGLYHYNDKIITSDSSFNVINSEALYNLHKDGVKYVTLSLESSLSDIKNITTNYSNNYKSIPNTEIVVYGHMVLMTTKYCPLKKYGECGKCKNHTYQLDDETGVFPITNYNCLTKIYNGKVLNLLDEISILKNYSSRFRLSFTIESYEETKEILKKASLALKEKTNFFDSKTDTRGYYKRDIF